MMALPKALGDLAWKELRDFAKEKDMPIVTGAERVGREEGRAEGLAEGLAQAREDLLAGIAALLDGRFGASGLALVPKIRRIEDLELLRNVPHSVKQADTPEALRRFW